jgi:hypothetical protein
VRLDRVMDPPRRSRADGLPPFTACRRIDASIAAFEG